MTSRRYNLLDTVSERMTALRREVANSTAFSMQLSLEISSPNHCHSVTEVYTRTMTRHTNKLNLRKFG